MARKLTMKEFLEFVPLGRSNTVHPLETFDGIQTGKYNESQLGFYVSLKGRPRDYSVGIPDKITDKLGKGEILTKRMKNPKNGEKVIFVYSKSVAEFLS